MTPASKAKLPYAGLKLFQAMPRQPAPSGGASLTVTSKGQVTLRKELHAEQATGTIAGFIGRLAGRSSHRASLQELQESIETGWAGLPCGELQADL